MSFKPIYYSASLSLFKSPKARSDQLLPRHGLAALGSPFCVCRLSAAALCFVACCLCRSKEFRGYLYKRGKNAFKTWNRRFFMLKDRQLSYIKKAKVNSRT